MCGARYVVAPLPNGWGYWSSGPGMACVLWPRRSLQYLSDAPPRQVTLPYTLFGEPLGGVWAPVCADTCPERARGCLVALSPVLDSLCHGAGAAGWVWPRALCVWRCERLQLTARGGGGPILLPRCSASMARLWPMSSQHVVPVGACEASKGRAAGSESFGQGPAGCIWRPGGAATGERKFSDFRL